METSRFFFSYPIMFSDLETLTAEALVTASEPSTGIPDSSSVSDSGYDGAFAGDTLDYYASVLAASDDFCVYLSNLQNLMTGICIFLGLAIGCLLAYILSQYLKH